MKFRRLTISASEHNALGDIFVNRFYKADCKDATIGDLEGPIRGPFRPQGTDLHHCPYGGQDLAEAEKMVREAA